MASGVITSSDDPGGIAGPRPEDLARAAAAGRDQLPERVPDPTVLDLFDAQLARTPEAPAVLFRGDELSYRELDRRALGLASRLRALGVGRDQVVGISVERSGALPI